MSVLRITSAEFSSWVEQLLFVMAVAMLRLAMVCTLGTVAADLASDEVSLNCGSHLGASGASDEAHKCSTVLIAVGVRACVRESL